MLILGTTACLQKRLYFFFAMVDLDIVTCFEYFLLNNSSPLKKHYEHLLYIYTYKEVSSHSQCSSSRNSLRSHILEKIHIYNDNLHNVPVSHETKIM